MKLSNRFKEIDKARVWIDSPFCALCTSNNNCSLHHIYGSKSKYANSIINSVMLCEHHHRIADCENVFEMGNPLRQKLLSLSLRKVFNSNYVLKDRDKNFIESVKEDIAVVLK